MAMIVSPAPRVKRQRYQNQVNYQYRVNLKRRRVVIPRALQGYVQQSGFYGRFAGSRGELKFHDLDIDDAVVAGGGTIAQVSCLTIAEGNGESDRIGRKLTVKVIQWKYNVSMLPQASTANPQGTDTVRVILYLDKQTNGATATVTGILESADYQAFHNLANSGRFTVLHDAEINLKLNAACGDGSAANDWLGESFSKQFYKQCTIPIEYDNSATTGVITSMRSNNLGVLLLSRSGVCNFDSKMRIRYSDSWL